MKEKIVSELGTLFAVTLKSTPSAELDRLKRLSDIYECLKIYDRLQLCREAECVLDTEMVSTFVRKVCLFARHISPLLNEFFDRQFTQMH